MTYRSLARLLPSLALVLVGCSSTPPATDAVPAPVVQVNRTPTLHRVGEGCSSWAQCESRACTADLDGSCGVCQDRRPLGASCGGPLEVCSPTATCTLGVCRSKLGEVGQACSRDPKGGMACDDDLYCRAEASASGGVCVPRIALGEPCAEEPFDVAPTCVARGECVDGICRAYRPSRLGESCADTSCEDGLACDPDGRRCVASGLIVGSPCGPLGDRYVDGCPAGTECRSLDGKADSPRTCMAPAHVGEPCGGGTCDGSSYCERLPRESLAIARCLPKHALGAPCEVHWQCEGELECRGGVCLAECR